MAWDELNECPSCGTEYKSLATHWGVDCDYPNFSQEQHEIIAGLLLGDGWLARNEKNPHLRVKMITEPYIRMLGEKFGVLCSDVSQNADDMWMFRTVSHPELHQYATWYDGSDKTWPEGINLTPKVLKHWYCGDGTFADHQSTGYIKIGMGNERGNEDKITRYFESNGLPLPTFDAGSSFWARWRVEQSKELFDYMGEPLPGFEYKWPEEQR